jgi:DNA mismatch repair ATPase MutS
VLTNVDGIGLACGVLEHLLNLEDPPKVIAATHFHEIFENDFLPLRPGLQLGHMEVKVCEESQQVEDQVTYLYKFVPPLSSSYAKANMNTTAFVLAEATRVTALCRSLRLCHPVLGCDWLTKTQLRCNQRH